ncbi:NAD(P)/FAD-dependent oxidoreductase [Aestuariibaculum sediminum]|uniref:FAD-dependent oxidoreductase n=1 Tax=Aestuariibaculum sediminum TaxID=2770637 RepID=A0A8J6Q3P4_9FLAO|nr:FAD-dependent oxidoreductase [Aestuariibaculum sediminum]MBD0832555.1 FAD-dependent oxidoreductase [Aestuariibaculum sediminum]
MKKIVVIGGGISGLCSAYYLLKEGHQVTVLDKSFITTGASFINAGYLTPSHFIPLAAPGIITQGLKWMLNSASPFYIKPRIDVDFFKWGLHFKKSATKKNVEQSIPVLKELNLKSQSLFEKMIYDLDFEFHYEKKGVLMAYTNAKSEEEEHKVAHRAIQEGLDVTCLSTEEVHQLEPVLSDNVIGGVHFKCDSHMTPNHFMNDLKYWLSKKGVVFKVNEEVKDFSIKGNEIYSVITQNETYEADAFVLASGSWTTQLAKKLNLSIPIQGGKGYSMDVHRPTGITIPTILVEARSAITPMDGFTRFAGTMEFSGNNNLVRTKRVQALANAVKTYYQDIEINEEERAQATAGLRPVSPDGVPFIGKTKKYKNLTVAAGHAMMGWSLGPITGKLVAELVDNKDTSVNTNPLSPERFS